MPLPLHVKSAYEWKTGFKSTWVGIGLLTCKQFQFCLFMSISEWLSTWLERLYKHVWCLLIFWTCLTHWGRVMHICISKLTINASDNGLSPGRCQAIIWNNAGILSIGPLGTNFSEILIAILIFCFKKMRLKVSSAKWRPFCLGLNVLSWNYLELQLAVMGVGGDPSGYSMCVSYTQDFTTIFLMDYAHGLWFIWSWMSNYICKFYMDLITYPCDKLHNG